MGLLVVCALWVKREVIQGLLQIERVVERDLVGDLVVCLHKVELGVHGGLGREVVLAVRVEAFDLRRKGKENQVVLEQTIRLKTVKKNHPHSKDR